MVGTYQTRRFTLGGDCGPERPGKHFAECFTGFKACKLYTRKCLTWQCLRVIINEMLRPMCRFMLVGTELIRRISRNPYLFIRRPQFWPKRGRARVIDQEFLDAIHRREKP